MIKMRDWEMTLLCFMHIHSIPYYLEYTINLEGVSVSAAESPKEVYQCIISL